ncbi:MAG: histidine phosphatase family protein [Gammaproteobacteria bacterium]|nr:histidine phosphatase family protein [Gammaproteobacteria bacterium]
MTTNAVSTLFDLLRHGEPVGGKKYRGQIDDPLSEKGWQQMRQAVGDYCAWDVIVTSPLSRCAAFAQELAARHAIPLEIEKRYRELGFGEWEGKTATELLAQDASLLMRFWQDPTKSAPPGGESLVEFHARVVSAFNETLKRHQGRRVLVVAHAGVIRLLVSHALDMPLNRLFRIDVPNASLTRLRVDHHDGGILPRLVFHAAQLSARA